MKPRFFIIITLALFFVPSQFHFILYAQSLDLAVAGNGISIGDSERVNGLRLNFRDSRLRQVNGINITIWQPRSPVSGTVNGIALGLPLTGAHRIHGLSISLGGVSAERNLSGVMLSGIGFGSGGDVTGIGIGGIGAGAGNNLKGIMIGGLGVGAGEDVTGILIGGLGAGAGGEMKGIIVGGLGIGSGEKIQGIGIGGLGAGSGGDVQGIFLGGIGVGAGNDLTGIAFGGVGAGAGGTLGALQLEVLRLVRATLKALYWLV